MIMSINDLIEKCVELTDGTIPVKELMEDYHLRFGGQWLNSPVNHVMIDKTNKSIELRFKEENVWKR